MKEDVKDYISELSEVDKLELLSLVANLKKSNITERETQAVLLATFIADEDDLQDVLEGTGLECAKDEFFEKFLTDDEFYETLSAGENFKEAISHFSDWAEGLVEYIDVEKDLGCSPDKVTAESSVINPFIGLDAGEERKFAFADPAKTQQFEDEVIGQIARAFGVRHIYAGSQEKNLTHLTARSRSRGFFISRIGKNAYIGEERRVSEEYDRLIGIAGREATRVVEPLTRRDLRGVYKFANKIELAANLIYDFTAESFNEKLIGGNKLARENKTYLVYALQYFAGNEGEKFSRAEIGYTTMLASLYATKYIITSINFDQYTAEGATKAICDKLDSDIALVASKSGYKPYIMTASHEVAKRIAQQFFAKREISFDQIANMFTNEGVYAREGVSGASSLNEAMFRTLYNPAEIAIKNLMDAQSRIDAFDRNATANAIANTNEEVPAVEPNEEVPSVDSAIKEKKEDIPAFEEPIREPVTSTPNGYRIHTKEEIEARKQRRRAGKEEENATFTEPDKEESDKYTFAAFNDDVISRMCGAVWANFDLNSASDREDAKTAYFYILKHTINNAYFTEGDIDAIQYYTKDVATNPNALTNIADIYLEGLDTIAQETFGGRDGYVTDGDIIDYLEGVADEYFAKFDSVLKLFKQNEQRAQRTEVRTAPNPGTAGLKDENEYIFEEISMLIFNATAQVINGTIKSFESPKENRYSKYYTDRDYKLISNKVLSDVKKAKEYIYMAEDGRTNLKEKHRKNPYFAIVDCEAEALELAKKAFKGRETITEAEKKEIISKYKDKMHSMMSETLRAQSQALYRNLQRSKKRELKVAIFDELKQSFAVMYEDFTAKGATKEVLRALKELNMVKIDIPFINNADVKLAEENNLTNDICNKCRVTMNELVKNKFDIPGYIGSDEFNADVNAIIETVRSYLDKKNVQVNANKEAELI